MVFNPDAAASRGRFTAFVTAELTPDQLDAIQTAFGKGSFSQAPTCPYELFIKDVPEYHDLSHANIRRAEIGGNPFLLIDENTPTDGGVWYIDKFASEEEVEDGEAENTNVLWKIRIKIEDVPIMHVNYDVGNASIREDLDNLGVDYPAPEDYSQDKLHDSCIDPDTEGYILPTWVTVEPGEYEETTDPEILGMVSGDKPEKMYRLKPDIARVHGLKPNWAHGSTAKDEALPDGTTKTFPPGSLVLQMDYDTATSWGAYQRPEGSL